MIEYSRTAWEETIEERLAKQIGTSIINTTTTTTTSAGAAGAAGAGAEAFGAGIGGDESSNSNSNSNVKKKGSEKYNGNSEENDNDNNNNNNNDKDNDNSHSYYLPPIIVRFEGEFKHGLKHGAGRCDVRTGKTIQGYWEYDSLLATLPRTRGKNKDNKMLKPAGGGRVNNNRDRDKVKDRDRDSSTTTNATGGFRWGSFSDADADGGDESDENGDFQIEPHDKWIAIETCATSQLTYMGTFNEFYEPHSLNSQVRILYTLYSILLVSHFLLSC